MLPVLAHPPVPSAITNRGGGSENVSINISTPKMMPMYPKEAVGMRLLSMEQDLVDDCHVKAKNHPAD